MLRKSGGAPATHLRGEEASGGGGDCAITPGKSCGRRPDPCPTCATGCSGEHISYVDGGAGPTAIDTDLVDPDAPPLPAWDPVGWAPKCLSWLEGDTGNISSSQMAKAATASGEAGIFATGSVYDKAHYTLPSKSKFYVCTGVPGVQWKSSTDFHKMFGDMAITEDQLLGHRTTCNVDLRGNRLYVDANSKKIYDDATALPSTFVSGNDNHTPTKDAITINVHKQVLAAPKKDAMAELRKDLILLDKKWGAPCLSPHDLGVLGDSDDCNQCNVQVCQALDPEGIQGCWDHGGVVAQNVYLHQDEDVVVKGYNGAADTKRGTQFVLRLRVVGDDIGDIDPQRPDESDGSVLPLQIGHVDPKPVNPVNPPPEDADHQQFANIMCTGFNQVPEAEKFANYQHAYNNTGRTAGWGNNVAYARTGSAVATRMMCGPGRFTIVARARPTSSKTLTGGRGYVLAIWTFAYTEMYGYGVAKTKGSTPSADAVATRYCPNCYTNVGCSKQRVTDDEGCNCVTATDKTGKRCHPVADACVGLQMRDSACELTATDAAARRGRVMPNLTTGTPCLGCYAALNQEIDLEFPTNAPSLSRDHLNNFSQTLWNNNITWNTMNMVPWQSDRNTYFGEQNYYSQFTAHHPPSASGEEETFISTDGKYHTYELEWLPSADPTKAVINFFFDGHLVLSSIRFTPRAASRLVIGPWLGWWASGMQPLDYDFAYVDVADILWVSSDTLSEVEDPSVSTPARLANHPPNVPSDLKNNFNTSKAWSTVPQTFDQATGTDGSGLLCGFGELVKNAARPGTANRTAGSGSKKWLPWVIGGSVGLFVLLATVIVLLWLNGVWWAPCRKFGKPLNKHFKCKKPKAKAKEDSIV